jgi:hypothetical protein
VINPSRSERGWRGGRRIAVLVALACAFGVISLGSAGTASAAFSFCKGSATPKSKGNPGKAMQVTWSCNTEVRAYGIASNKAIASFSNPPVISGTPSPFVNCTVANGSAGFGCGISNRAEPGTQNANSTGGSSTCGRSTTVIPAGPQGNPPRIDGITGPPCNQIIAPNSVVKQDVTLAANPCKFKPNDPLNMMVIAGGEPPVASLTPRGDTTTVGQYLTEPFKLKLKGYQGCQPDAKSAKKGGAKAAATGGVNLNPLSCGGEVTPKDPAKPGLDARYEFSCGANIRTFALVANRKLDFFGVEPEVHGPGTYSTPCVDPPAPFPPLTDAQCASGESAVHQCEGPFPSLGFGCGFPDRQADISSTLDYGRRLSALNTLTGEIGFQTSPCKKGTGLPKPKVWIVAMNEPRVPPNTPEDDQTTGLFVSEPFQLAVTGYGKGPCSKSQPRGKKQ